MFSFTGIRNCKTLKEWVEKNRNQLGRSYDSINNDYHTACITADMCGEEHIGKYAPHALLQMKNISPEKRKKLFKYAQEEFGEEVLDDTELTNANVKKFMVRLGYKLPRERANNNSIEQLNKKVKEKEMAHETRKNKFIVMLDKSKGTFFSQRLAAAIPKYFPPKSTLRICRELLKERNCKDGIRAINKAIKQLDTK